ncbi:MAG: hypothetical protein K1X94_10960 [Sandaracinaceae bacterium]|nr:hypothetical protein [Sandaracinaceae bacterium]
MPFWSKSSVGGLVVILSSLSACGRLRYEPRDADGSDAFDAAARDAASDAVSTDDSSPTRDAASDATLDARSDASLDAAGDAPTYLPFTLGGMLAGELAPGVTLPYDLAITNPNDVAIHVLAITVELDHVDPAHAAGCVLADNYTSADYSGDYAGLDVPARTTLRLSELGVPSAEMPQITMIDAPFDQSACLGATIFMNLGGLAVQAL